MKTIVIKVSSKRPENSAILRAAKILRSGGLVAFPTETVYGLAALADCRSAIRRLRLAKNRPKGKPFTVHISSMAGLKKMRCPLTSAAKALAKRFWPGPLTMVLLSRDGRRIGFRIPDNKIALKLIKAAQEPIVAPSANSSDNAPPKSAKDVLRELDGKIDIILDGGRTRIGIESTVVDLSVEPFRILRQGAISRKKLLSVIG